MIWLTFSLVKQNKGRTPAPSYHPSRDSVEMHRNFYINAIAEPPKDHSTAKRAVSPLATSRVYVSNHDFLQALLRDNYRCMVTGAVDRNAYNAMRDTERQQFGLVGAIQTTTNFCHIFPPSTNLGLKPEVQDHPKVLSLTPSFQCRLLI
jgi:hypothetical protein